MERDCRLRFKQRNSLVDQFVPWTIMYLCFPSCDEQSVALAIQGMFSNRQQLDAEIEKLQNDVLFAQALAIQGMFSNRQQLDAEIEKLQNDVLFAQEEDRDISALEKGIEAERRLAHLKLLRRDQKFRTVQDMKEEIKFLSVDLQQVSSLEDRLSIVKKINALLEQIGPDEICVIDESNVRGKQDAQQQVGGTREKVFCQEICIHLHHSPSRLSRLHANYFF